MSVRLLRGTLEDTGEVIFKGTDGVVIIPVRKRFYYPFSAPGWTDLRLGFFLSLTDDTADDTITGLAETLAGVVGPDERYWIGLRNGLSGFPRNEDGAYKTTFIGFTNSKPTDGPAEAADDSVLSSSDAGVTGANAFFWRPHNSTENFHSAMIIDGETVLAGSTTGVQQHFPQSVEDAGGYSVLLGFRLRRDTPTSLIVRCEIPQPQALSADIMYSSVPTKELITETLSATWASGSQVLDSVVEMSEVPSGLFLYWPFHGSRLRCHAVDLGKVA